MGTISALDLGSYTRPICKEVDEEFWEVRQAAGPVPFHFGGNWKKKLGQRLIDELAKAGYEIRKRKP